MLYKCLKPNSEYVPVSRLLNCLLFFVTLSAFALGSIRHQGHSIHHRHHYHQYHHLSNKRHHDQWKGTNLSIIRSASGLRYLSHKQQTYNLLYHSYLNHPQTVINTSYDLIFNSGVFSTKDLPFRNFRSLVDPGVPVAVLHDAVVWPVKREAVLEGDVILGGLMMVHEREDTVTCGPIMPQGGIQALETMLYTLDVINSEGLLPFTLGAHVLDDCDKDTYGLEMAVDFIKGKIIELL